MKNILVQIRDELKANTDPKTQKSFQRFFKEQVKYYGVKTGTVGKIAKKYWKQVKTFDKPTIFLLCEELYRSDYTEEAFIVSFWLPNYIEHLELSDLAIFKMWIGRYINNWAKCDGFCNHTVGDLIQKYPESLSEVKSWAKSDSRWLKRASAVSLIVPAKKGEFLQEAFEICGILLVDEDDIVQKGYGWLLKEESRKHQKEVYDYVVKNKETMPRTALRYAVELMPKELKAQAMKRE
ncbi:MAG: DNA alkylation repair protein [Candidatus Bathyarchaeia archaeon]|jgi:3-methyladenine DNA glycosylase AlkD